MATSPTPKALPIAFTHTFESHDGGWSCSSTGGVMVSIVLPVVGAVGCGEARTDFAAEIPGAFAAGTGAGAASAGESAVVKAAVRIARLRQRSAER